MSHIPLQPLKLAPIPWGQPDPALAKESLARMRDLTPRFHYAPRARIPGWIGWGLLAGVALCAMGATAGGAA